jgi:hypothetical protein
MEVWSGSLILTMRREVRRRGLARIIRIPFESTHALAGTPKALLLSSLFGHEVHERSAAGQTDEQNRQAAL